jgi:hypothetical protein
VHTPNPANKNIQTATKERRLILGSPQRPCPEVQPPLNLAPNPVNNPAIKNPGKVVH